MAITTVKGTVTRIFHNGTGAEVTESFSVRGEQVSKRWSCWFDAAHGLSDGQTVEVSGLHGDKVEAWETKDGETRHSVKRSLNKAKVKGADVAAPADDEPWATTGAAYDESTPF